jgi:hypothetical protein
MEHSIKIDPKKVEETINTIWFKRANHLSGKGFYIEAFLLVATLIEDELRTIVSSYEDLMVTRVGKASYNPGSVRKKPLEKLTIGQLIGWLTVYCDDKPLLKKLSDFNKLRIRHVHGLVKSSPGDVNLALKNKMIPTSELLILITLKNVEILKENIELTSKASSLINIRLDS